MFQIDQTEYFWRGFTIISKNILLTYQHNILLDLLTQTQKSLLFNPFVLDFTFSSHFHRTQCLLGRCMNLLVTHQSGEQKGFETLVEEKACRKTFWADTTTCYRLREKEWACANKKTHKIKAEKKAGSKITGKSCAKSLKIQRISAICMDPRGFSKKRIWTGHSQLPHESNSAF